MILKELIKLWYFQANQQQDEEKMAEDKVLIVSFDKGAPSFIFMTVTHNKPLILFKLEESFSIHLKNICIQLWIICGITEC